MPYKSDKIAINNEKLDRRVKLSAEDKREIKILYEDGTHSQRKLADMYGVSRRTIQFIIDPEKLIANKQRRKERGGSKKYYDREKHNESMKKHRAYKNDLYQSGLIK